jgi:hypothetical protein
MIVKIFKTYGTYSPGELEPFPGEVDFSSWNNQVRGEKEFKCPKGAT